ncbi:MAG: helix-turn-helix transcriptional regulator [Clostridia bacterium]|nr:helix-turn-helix transcriptional regulator [Clostridia bacterium]
MNDRIKSARKALGLTQSEFGSRIGISGAAVSKLESGDRNPSDQTLMLISSEYQISLQWLQTGTGDMFTQGHSLADDLAKKYSFPDITRKLLVEYEKLGEDQQAAVLEYATKFVASIVGDAAIEEEVAAYRQELIDQKEKESSASETGNEDMVG